MKINTKKNWTSGLTDIFIWPFLYSFFMPHSKIRYHVTNIFKYVYKYNRISLISQKLTTEKPLTISGLTDIFLCRFLYFFLCQLWIFLILYFYKTFNIFSQGSKQRKLCIEIYYYYLKLIDFITLITKNSGEALEI